MMTICPGKKGASIYGAPWNRSLELDGQQIAKWEATSIVTLMRDSEFPKVGIPTSDCIRSAANIARHYQVPVHDLRAPCYDPFDDNILIRWQQAIENTMNQLMSGARVVVHCRGGLGRTGTFVAELLIRSGYSPQTAIRNVRTARPGAIETQDQLFYLQKLRQNHNFFDGLLKYQVSTRSNVAYDIPITRPALILASEIEQLLARVKTMHTDGGIDVYKTRKYDLTLKLGDCLWALSRLADDLDQPLDEVAKQSLENTSHSRKMYDEAYPEYYGMKIDDSVIHLKESLKNLIQKAMLC
jgi:protein-tyrosine phosphatase